ncbi:MFS transporter [Roseobacter weihaiensis]|uniref:MFS transporter n=1 Tax=Roseobacter weihaiensis TaxID=2763262 RepID=UPI001D0B53DE|nr:MFS transporter [Roseobacter sp. H9]
MTSPLANPSFRWLFSAQISSLVGVGLLTVALSLAAYRIGGAQAAGQLLGLLLALKMVAYVGLAPLAEMLLAGLSRKAALVSLDLGRMLLLVPMAFTSNLWHIAGLSFVFFALSAGFTPLYQAVIPDVVPEEDVYARALSWSRIAYTLEAVLSPVIAGALLTVVAGHALFLVAALAFAGSMAAVLMARFPAQVAATTDKPFWQRASRGLVIYLRTPRLRGVFLLNLALSLAMAWILVNTVVYAGVRLGASETYLPVLMGFYGLGAAVGAGLVPRLVKSLAERRTMSMGTFLFAAVGCVFAALPAPTLAALAVIWIGFGLASSLVLTPGGLVLTRSAQKQDRAAVFAAQFSLSHAGWLVAYPLAGWMAVWLSLETAMLVLSLMCVATTFVALRVWPAHDPLARAHAHPELPDDHPHLLDARASGPDHRHVHAYVIDDLHPSWSYGIT